MTVRFWVIMTFLFVSQMLSARGAYVNEQEYLELLNREFPKIVQAIENGEITAEAGKALLADLRNRYGRHYRDADGIMESLIDQLGESQITAADAVLQFSLLLDGRLMSYRRDRTRREERETSSDSTSSQSTNTTGSDSGSGNKKEENKPDSGGQGGENQKGGGGSLQNRNGR